MELGIMEKESEAQALIGEEVIQSIDEINKAQKEVAKDLKDHIRLMGDKLKK